MNFKLSNDKYIVYLKKEYIINIDFSIKEEVEKLFKELFLKIKERINMELSGFFFIKVYLNDSFGAIIEFEKENVEYYEYLTNKIDMQIEILNDTNILKEYDDIDYINDNIIYLYQNKYYTKYLDDSDSEFFNIVYGEKANDIIDNSLVCHLKKI